jgi:vacuolar-type H+-ATPase subunit I/STV1
MYTTTANRIFWGLVILVALGLLIYVLVVLGQRFFTSQLDELNLKLATHRSEIEKLIARGPDETTFPQVESLASQVTSLHTALQAMQKETEGLKAQMVQIQSEGNPSTAIVNKLEVLEGAVDEVEMSLVQIRQQVQAFEQQHQALEHVLGPVLALDNPIVYDSTCPSGYSALEVTFQIWSANTELDRLRDYNRDRLICKASSASLTLPMLQQVITIDQTEEAIVGAGGMR